MSIVNKPTLTEDNLSTQTASEPQLRSVDTPTSAADVRRLVKALSEDRALYIKIRSANSPSEKHAILRGAGLTPVAGHEIQSELAKCLRQGSRATELPEDSEFIGQVLHLIGADSVMNISL